MFVKQVEVLLALQPWAICLEISDNAAKVNNGDEVFKVKTVLEEAYIVYCKLIAVWRHGDPSNRKGAFHGCFAQRFGPSCTWIQAAIKRSLTKALCHLHG